MLADEKVETSVENKVDGTQNAGVKKKFNNKKGKEVGGKTMERNEGHVPVLKSTIANLSCITRPARTFYLVDVAALFHFACAFGNAVSRWGRRGGWNNFSYYAGMFLWALGAKLQRVGIASDQIQPLPQQVISVRGLSLPSSIIAIVNQFGIKTDIDKVQIIPYVTPRLIRLLTTLAVDGQTAVGYAIPGEEYGCLFTHAYGTTIAANVALLRTAQAFDAPFRGSYINRKLDLAAMMMIDDYRSQNGVPLLTDPQRGVLWSGAAAVGFWAAHVTYAAPAIGFGGVGGLPGPMVAILDREFGRVSSPNPVAAAFAAGAHAAGISVYPDLDDAVYECSEMAQHCAMSAMPVSAEGTFAPLCCAMGNDVYVMSTFIKEVSPAEYTLGAILNMECFLCGADGIPFTGHDKLARVQRYTTTPLAHTPLELRAILFREMTLRG